MRKFGVVFTILTAAFILWPRLATAGDQPRTLLAREPIMAAPTRVAGNPPLSPPVEPPPQQPPSSGPDNPINYLTGPNPGDPLAIALNYLGGNSANLQLAAGDLADVLVTDRYTSQHNGVTHIYLRQRLNGLEIYGANLNINISRDGRVINVGNRFVSNAQAAASATGPALSAVEAVEQAALQLGLVPTGLTPRQSLGGPARATILTNGGISQDDIPVKLVYQPDERGELRLAWDMVIHPPDGENWWSLRVDANTGKILSQVDWVAHDNYYVYPLPLESPNDGPRSLVVDPAAANPTASPYGWHDTDGVAGPEFTITQGNNVLAQDDKASDNDTTPGYRPDGGPGLVFSSTIDSNLEAATYITASIINLFYWNNILHDLLYQYGFDEAAGNFQQNTYGRSGTGGDPVQADAQDGGGVNNANFSTPPDGEAPRMQMYIWTGTSTATLQVNAPAIIAGGYTIGTAAFGPRNSTVTAGVKLADDGVGTVTDGCESFAAGFFTGLIALIDRGGGCTYVAKVKNAQDAGAIGVIMVNNIPGPPPGMGGIDRSITILTLSLSQADGALLKGQLPAPGVNVTLTRSTEERDSSLDNGIIIHEYGHGISNRLTGGPSNTDCLGTTEARGMGEGWSDFLALALTAQAGDTGPQGRGIGTYANFEPADGLGIRRYPYSTDMSINPLTVSDMPGTMGSVHNIGEIWNSMLWDVYWTMVGKYGFDPDLYNGTGGNNRALQLVTDGMKFQPCFPSFTDARDAILLANLVNNGGTDQCSIWEGFVKRGLGPNANTGNPNNQFDDTSDFSMPGFCTNTLVLHQDATPSPAQVGGLLTYTLQARNFLTNTVNGVVLTSALPLSTSYVAGSASNGGSLNGNMVQWAIGPVASNQIVTRTFQVRVDTSLNVAESFFDDAENGDSAWVINHTAGSLDWALSTAQPFAGSTSWAAADPAEVSDQRLVLANPITVPAGQSLSFWHFYNTEAAWDGGVVEISTDGGTNWIDLGPQITLNGYNQTINSGSQNPIANRQAFSGNSGGYIKTVVDLSSYSGQSILIRFRMTSDEAAGGDGWYIDDIYIGEPGSSLLSTAGVTGNGLDPVTTTLTTLLYNTALLSYSPTQMSATLPSNQQVTQTLTLSNTGGRTLNFSLTENATWASLSPSGGTVSPFSSTTVAVIFNSSVISVPGNYSTTVNFSGNMINGPITPLPLYLEVTNDPVSDTALLSYSPAQMVATMKPNQQVTQTLTITNSGTLTLTFSLAESAAWATVSPSGGTVPPSSSTTVAVIFNSSVLSATGTYTTNLNFSGNMSNGPVPPLPLRLELKPPDHHFPIISKN